MIIALNRLMALINFIYNLVFGGIKKALMTVVVVAAAVAVIATGMTTMLIHLLN